jgi:hypothetical protein
VWLGARPWLPPPKLCAMQKYHRLDRLRTIIHAPARHGDTTQPSTSAQCLILPLSPPTPRGKRLSIMLTRILHANAPTAM